MNSTLASSGRFAMCSTARPTCATSISGSAFGPERGMALASSVPALPMSIWPHAMSNARPSSAMHLVMPVTPCLVAV
jgi:hypothetical protein